MKAKKMLSKAEVASRFRVCTRTLERWAASGLLVPAVSARRVVRYCEADIDRAIRDGLRAGR